LVSAGHIQMLLVSTQEGGGMNDFGDRLLGADRDGRRLRAIGKLAAAHAWSKKQSEEAQRVPVMFMDALEQRLESATGGRRRELLGVYDMLLDAIELAMQP